MRRGVAKRPSPALVVSVLALFIALGGSAGAVTRAVPLAKRAFVADNAKKLNGLTATQLGTASAVAAVRLTLAQSPPGARPASTATGVVSIKSSSLGSVGAGSGVGGTISCAPGEQVIGGGYNANYPLVVFQSYPIDSGTWRFFFFNYTENTSPAVTIYASCVK